MYDDNNNKRYTVTREPGCGMPIAFLIGTAALMAFLVFMAIVMN